MLNRLVNEFLQAGKGDNGIKALLHLLAGKPHNRAIKEYIFATAQIGMKASTQFQ